MHPWGLADLPRWEPIGAGLWGVGRGGGDTSGWPAGSTPDQGGGIIGGGASQWEGPWEVEGGSDPDPHQATWLLQCMSLQPIVPVVPWFWLLGFCL